ncbi:T9SS type A sorting domain-containing protein [candidate division KSB1 bacterium]|nr:T9SS type A sorting domain-containing protein [candidate division KSB1 bacterium]
MKTLLAFLLSLMLLPAAFAQLDTVWTRGISYPGFESVFTGAIAFQDGGYLAWGSRTALFSDAIVARFDASGDTLWTRVLGDLEDDVVGTVVPIAENRYLVCGTTDTPGRQNALLYVVLNADGTTYSQLDFGGDDLNGAVAAEQSSDSGAVMIGHWLDPGSRLFVMGIAPNGSILAVHRLPDPYTYFDDFDISYEGDWVGAISEWDSLHFVRVNQAGQVMLSRYLHGWNEIRYPLIRTHLNGGFLLALNARRFGGTNDVYLSRLTEDGDTIWSRSVGDHDPSQRIEDILILPLDGRILLCGAIFGHNLALLETNGDTLWTASINYAPRAIVSATPQNVVFAGQGPTRAEACLVNLSLELGAVGRNVVQSSWRLSSYPNPFNPATTISLTIPQTAHTVVTVFDIMGREVQTLHDGVLERGEHQFMFDGGTLRSGLYFARVTSGSFGGTQKLLLLK